MSEHFQAHEPNEREPAPAPMESAASDSGVACPHCSRFTDSLKSYDMAIIVFLVVYIFFNTERVNACPACMRAFLAKRALIAIPMANVLFPISFIQYLVLYFSTTSAGHTDPIVANNHRITVEEQFERLANKVSRKKTIKEAVILMVVVAAIAGFWAWLFFSKSQ